MIGIKNKMVAWLVKNKQKEKFYILSVLILPNPPFNKISTYFLLNKTSFNTPWFLGIKNYKDWYIKFIY